MDSAKRKLLERHLAWTELHVAQGVRLIERQRVIIRRRQRDGIDVELSQELLEQMELTHNFTLAERARLRRELRD